MEKKSAFEKFAPAILQIYHRDKEAFWAAVMAPFLANTVSLTAWWNHLKVDAELLSAFRGLDDQAQEILRDFGAPLGVDVTRWKSNRTQYFKDAYPIFAFLVVWMDEEGLSEYLNVFDDVLRCGVYGVAGYGILDENVDGDSPSPAEILMSQALIAAYETLVLKVFGITPVNLEILNKMRSLFLMAEIKEKSLRGKASPYSLEHPEDCGIKGAHVVTPFMLSLERLDKAGFIDAYWEVFLLFGAVIQIIDDWTDLEKDLAVGHYSYVTLGSEQGVLQAGDIKKTIQRLRTDPVRVAETYRCSKQMIERSRAILAQLKDPYLQRLVDVTDLRLEAYFRKDLKMR